MNFTVLTKFLISSSEISQLFLWFILFASVVKKAVKNQANEEALQVFPFIEIKEKIEVFQLIERSSFKIQNKQKLLPILGGLPTPESLVVYIKV